MTRSEPTSPRSGGAAGPPSAGEHAPLLTRNFILILVNTGLFGLAFSAYFLIPKYLTTELAADPTTVGGLSAVTMFFSVVLMPIVGSGIDRRGRKPYSIAGAAVFTLAAAGMLVVEEVGPLLWVLRAMHGAAFTLFIISLSTLATDIAPTARLGQAIGLFGGVMISTNALGPALAEWAALQYGWDSVFGATMVAAALATVLTRFVHEEPRAHDDEAPTKMLALITRPGLRRLLTVAALSGAAMGTLFTFYQPWALSRGFEHVSGYLIAFAACAMFVRFGLGGIADRFGRLRVATISLFAYIAAPASLIWIDALGLVIAGCLLGLSHGLFFPAMNAVVLERASARERGKAMAAYHGSFNIGFSIGSYVYGFIAVAAGFPVIFVMASIGCAVGFALLVTVAHGPHTLRRAG